MGTTVYSVEDCCATNLPQPNIPPGVIVGPPGPQGPEGPPGPPGECPDCPDVEDPCEWCCPIFCGEGSPEGVIEAPVGAIYEQTDALITSHSLWIKREGTGDTGWRAWAGLRGSGDGSLAVGDNSVASAEDTIAFGEDATATAARAQSWGKSSRASAADAKAIGNTEANNVFQLNFGHNNVISDDLFPGSTEAQIIIGNNNTYEGTNGADGTGAGTGAVAIVGNNNEVYQDGDNVGFPGKLAVYGDYNYVHAVEVYLFGSACQLVENPGGTLEASSYGVVMGLEVEALADCFAAIGYQAFAFGIGATALGPHAGAGVDDDSIHTTAVGRFSLSEGDRSVAVGSSAFTEFEESIGLGHGATPDAANKLRIGSLAAPIDTIEVYTSAGVKTVTINP